VPFQLVLLIIAYVFAVLTGLVLAVFLALPRARLLSVVGAVVFAALVGAGTYAFAMSITVDPLSYALGAYGAMAAGAAIGALLADFLVSLGRRRTRPTEI
jgi:hypothetical protein